MQAINNGCKHIIVSAGAYGSKKYGNGVHAVTSPQIPIFSGAVPVHKVLVVFTFTGASPVN